jgi:hypothetical protein
MPVPGVKGTMIVIGLVGHLGSATLIPDSASDARAPANSRARRRLLKRLSVFFGLFLMCRLQISF